MGTIGTIKIKNKDGYLEPFYPNISAKLYDLFDIFYTNIINEYSSIESKINNMNGKMQIMYDEPTYSNTEKYIKKTMIAYIEYDDNEFAFSVDTSYTNGITGLPFILDSFRNSTSSLTINWGDDTTTVITKADLLNDSSLLCHTYDNPRKYNIYIKSDDWENIYIAVTDRYVEPNNIQTNDNMMYYKNTLLSINTDIKSGGTVDEESNTSTTNYDYLFQNCKHLVSVKNDAFQHNSNIISLNHTFDGCSSITKIPSFEDTNIVSFNYCFANCGFEELPDYMFLLNCDNENNELYNYSFIGTFSNCAKLKKLSSTFIYSYYSGNEGDFEHNYYQTANFNYCFENCTKLTQISPLMFDGIKAISMKGTFKNCISLTSIPGGLFDNLNDVTDYSECFYGCANLSSIPSFLFYKSTASNFTSCFENCNALTDARLYFDTDNSILCDNFVTNTTGNTIYICVNENSAKETSFENIEQSTGILINNNCSLQSFEFVAGGGIEIGTQIGLPFVLNYNLNKKKNLFIDWGDGTYKSLDNNSYDNDEWKESFEFKCIDYNLLKTYFTVNDVNVKVISDSWNNIVWSSISIYRNYSNDLYKNIFNFYDNIKEIVTPLPKIETRLVCNYNRNNEYELLEQQQNDFNNLFVESNIETVCSNLFVNNSNVTDFTQCFFNCKKLQLIPSGLFDSCVNATTFNKCFTGCTSLTSISDELFKYNTQTTDFSYCFANCTSILSIPGNLFENCSNAETFEMCFCGLHPHSYSSYYAQYSSIPDGLFDDCVNAKNFKNCFAYWDNASFTVPEHLFDNCVNAETFNRCFYACCSLTALPENLFKYNTKVTDFSDCFAYCNSLTSIPTGLFDNCADAYSFSGCFTSCILISSIPSGLFDDCINAAIFDGCFQNCTSLTSIHQDLFKYNVNAYNFNNCFCDCSSITSIPATLFSNCIKSETFYGCFEGCSSLTSIPEHLFDNCVMIKNFGKNGYTNNGCFANCTSLKSIPEDLFKYNIGATDFYACFYQCTSLTSIPEDLFKYNTNATYFSYCFAYCSKIASIPITLFYYNTKIKTVGSCFYGCTSLVDYKIIFTAENINYTFQFSQSKSGTYRVVCVPYSSITYNAFREYASSNGCTISTTDEDCMEYIEYTIDTEATTVDAKLGAIPLINTSSEHKLIVDWGDNNTQILYASDFTKAGYIHEYTTPGIYTINAYYIFSSEINIVSVAGDTNIDTEPIRIFRDTFIGVDPNQL